MAYTFLDDVAIADIAFSATAKTLEELFSSAADATMNAMVNDLSTIQRSTQKSVSLEAEAVDLLLVNFLQEMIYYKDAQRLLLLPERLHIEQHDHHLSLQATLSGEPINPSKHELKVDVKAVTFHRLKVAQTPKGWEAMVVLDI